MIAVTNLKLATNLEVFHIFCQLYYYIITSPIYFPFLWNISPIFDCKVSSLSGNWLNIRLFAIIHVCCITQLTVMSLFYWSGSSKGSTASPRHGILPLIWKRLNCLVLFQCVDLLLFWCLKHFFYGNNVIVLRDNVFGRTRTVMEKTKITFAHLTLTSSKATLFLICEWLIQSKYHCIFRYVY